MRRISEDDLDVDNHNSDNPEIVRVYWQCLNKRWEECNDYSFDVDNHSFGYNEIGSFLRRKETGEFVGRESDGFWR